MQNKKSKTSVADNAATIRVTLGELVEFLYPGAWDSNVPLDWPPDAFACASFVLQKSGAYGHVVRTWPPPAPRREQSQTKSAIEWAKSIRRTGELWRRAYVEKKRVPIAILEWWTTVASNRTLAVSDVRKHKELCDALIQLCAAADEACDGVGIPSGDNVIGNPFEIEADSILVRKGSLCARIDPSRARVLPKMHTPQNGLTIRSISHNLAFLNGSEVEPKWYIYPGRQGHSLSLLLLPWPVVVTPSQFGISAPRTGKLLNMPAEFGFFTYQPRAHLGGVARNLNAILREARQVVGRIDGVILPELALGVSDYRKVSARVLKDEAFLICGVAEPSAAPDKPGRNYVALDFPLPGNVRVPVTQQKHHRWKLDKSQIHQYGLGNSLDPRMSWWEHISMEPRTLAFISMRPWLTITALICEDLGRQDPMADLVRAVAPNLVIALLMDAPQLASRWPARYATVLAEDPGSSVLTLTSLGMAGLSRPPNTKLRPRVVALWKDARTGVPIEIELPSGRDAVVLTLTVESIEEFSADGRRDDKAAGYPVLSGMHFV